MNNETSNVDMQVKLVKERSSWSECNINYLVGHSKVTHGTKQNKTKQKRKQNQKTKQTKKKQPNKQTKN